jgi:hypothetical protein
MPGGEIGGADGRDHHDQSGIQCARSWAAREPGALASVNEQLAVEGSGLEAIAAQGLCRRLDNVERIDRMIMTAEARRNATLREIDRHRETLGRRLRQAVVEAEEATLEVVDAQESTTLDASGAHSVSLPRPEGERVG